MEVNKEVLIIGAGAAGISAAIYLARSKHTFELIEKDMIGGKLNVIGDIENYPGIISIKGPDLVSEYQKQLNNLNIKITKDNIIKIIKNNDGFDCVSDNNIYHVKAVIIATGSNNKKLNIPGEEEFLGKGISYCAVCDGFFNKDKDVLVYGRESRAIQEALYLEPIVNKLYFVSDKEFNNLDEKELNLFKSNKVEFLYPFSIKEFKGNFMGLSSVVLINNETREEKEINCFSAFPFFGEVPSSYLIKELDIKNSNGFICVDENQMTNVPGIFAAGDIVKKSLKQVVTASSDGAIAATSAIKFIK